MVTRREFLGAMLAACAAPAIVRADSLMRIVPTAMFGYGLPPVGVLARVLIVTPWEKSSVVGKYFDKPQQVGYTSEWKCDIEIAPELNIPPQNVTSMGFLANTPSGLLVADPKMIVSWERV